MKQEIVTRTKIRRVRDILWGQKLVKLELV